MVFFDAFQVVQIVHRDLAVVYLIELEAEMSVHLVDQAMIKNQIVLKNNFKQISLLVVDDELVVVDKVVLVVVVQPQVFDIVVVAVVVVLAD
jgi:hypothetical protein